MTKQNRDSSGRKKRRVVRWRGRRFPGGWRGSKGWPNRKVWGSNFSSEIKWEENVRGQPEYMDAN